MNQSRKAGHNTSFKTKAVKKLDTTAKPGSRSCNSNRLEIPRRRKGHPDPAHSNPTAPYPEKGSPIWFVIVLLALFLQLPRAAAQTDTLTNGNSSVTIDSGSPAGVDNWTVEGQNQLNTEWFWYRIGNSGTAASIDTLGAPTVSQSAPGTLTATYQSTQFSLQVIYSLAGGAVGSGTSDLSQQIKIQNLTSAPLAFNFFQYTDFSLVGANNQNVLLSQNLQGKFNSAQVTSGNTSVTESTVSAFSPGANFGEAALGSATIASLQNTAGYNLNNNTQAGPGNAAWALQWSSNIAANGKLTINEDLNMTGVAVTPVPEPPAWAMLSLGLIAATAIKRYLAPRG